MSPANLQLLFPAPTEYTVACDQTFLIYPRGRGKFYVLYPMVEHGGATAIDVYNERFRSITLSLVLSFSFKFN